MNKSSKVIAGIIVILLIIWGISAANRGDKQEASKEPVKIGGAYILSGPVSLVGELQKNATKMAVDEINAAGGINGRQFEVVQEDSQYDSRTALSAYQVLKLKGIKIIVADGSPVAAPLRPIVIADGNFMIVPGATTPAYFDGENRSCRIALTAKNFGPAQTDLLLSRGYRKIATFHSDNEGGRGFYEALEKDFIAKGGKIVVGEFYQTNATDYRTGLSKIKAKLGEIDAIVIQHVTNAIEPLLKQMKELGISKPVITDYYTINNPALKDLALANDIEFVDYEYAKTDLTTDSDRVKAFKANYRKLYSTDPTYFSASTYDSIYLIADAIKAVGEDPAKVGAYISGLKGYKAITGTLSFNSDCEVERLTKLSRVAGGEIVDFIGYAK